MKPSILCLVILLFFCQGCLFSSKQQVRDTSPALPSVGQVLKPKVLQQGGGVVIIPFKAGEGALAGEKLDKVSLMIVKGIADYFEGQGSRFKVLDSENAEKANFVIEGFVEDLKEPSKIKKVVMFDKTALLEIKADMRAVETDERVIYFSRKKNIFLKHGNVFDLAYQIGQEMGQLITQTAAKAASGDF